MKPKESWQGDLEALRRQGDPRLSDDDRAILRDVARGPDLAIELNALTANDPAMDRDIAG